MNVKDLPPLFKPLATAEEIEAAEKWLKENKQYFKSTANFMVMGDVKYPTPSMMPFTSQACHRNISTPGVNNRSVVATECAWQRGNEIYKKTKDLVRPFLRWLLSDDCYMSFFVLNKDEDFILDNGFVVSADVPATLLQNLMITTRHFYEVSSLAFRKFNEYTEKGMNPSLAYILFFCSNLSSLDEGDYQTQPVQGNGGHRALPLLTLKSLENFLGGELIYGGDRFFSEDSFYRNTAVYTGGRKFFQSGTYTEDLTYSNHVVKDLLEIDEVKSLLSEYRKQGAGGIYKPPNPFKREPMQLRPDQVSWKEFFDVLLPYLENHLREKGLI